MSQQKQPSTNNNQTSKNAKKSLELLLPPSISKKKTLVLDLDETLVHSQFGPFNTPSDVVINIEIENELHDIHVLVRPGVKEFLEKMSKKFEIIIFTASISKYAGPLLDILDKDKNCSFRLFREHCTLLNSSFVKDLKKLGRDLKDVIIVDNSPMAYLLNSDNGLPILTWFDDKNDKELFKIIPILDFLSLVPDVRDYIHKIVINNEISYDIAKKVIKEFNDKYRKTKDEKETKVLDRKVNNSSIEENIEISDGSDNNLAVINQDKNKQQININIINNNITNYIYDNKQSSKDENISDNIMTNEIQNKINKHNFNPNSIIASVNKPNTAQTLSSLTPFIKEKKNKNSNSAKNINSKNGQNMNNYIHKKSESTGIGYKQKAKKNNYEEFLNINNKNIKNNNNSLRNNTNYNYSSKSQNRKETKIKSNMNNNGDSNAKSAKMINNIKKQLYLNNNNNKNILVNKKHFMKNNDEKNQIKIINDGNLTSVHNNQKIMLNINNTEKTHRNHNKKNKTNTANNLLHSVDFANNEIAMYYHNDNFPFSKNGNFIHNGGYTSKNRNINKFLKKNNINNNKKSSSIDNEMNKNFQEKNKFNDIKLNNEFKYSKNKNKDKRIAINYTLQEEQKQQNPKKEKMQTLNNNNLLKEHTKSNSAVNINSNGNINLAHSQQINPRSGSMKNLILEEKEEKKNKNKKNSVTKRPKSSTVFKKNKSGNKNKQMKRNASGRNNKNINIMKYDIIEILERRGIAKTNRLKHFRVENHFNFIHSNYVINSINQNIKNKNLQNNLNEKNKTTDNVIKIKTKDA
jgi:Dullard-like phosphatase family protein